VIYHRLFSLLCLYLILFYSIILIPFIVVAFLFISYHTVIIIIIAWIPNTHATVVHNLFRDEEIDPVTGESPKDTLLRTSPSVLGVLPKGSCAIFDSKLLHCGGANESDISRALFYLSFKNTGLGYPGNPASIRPELHSKYTLKTLEAELKKLKKKR